jgi:uncharacterized protein
MKIFIAQIPPEGVSLSENIPVKDLDLETEIIKFHEPIMVKALVTKITNAVTFDLEVAASMHCLCSRCVEEFVIPLEKHLKFSVPVDRSIQSFDLNPEIREELMLDYPVRPLCQPDCLGLCVKCGHNLNRGRCSCPAAK